MVQTISSKYKSEYINMLVALYTEIEADKHMPLVEKTDILQRLYDVFKLLLKYES